MKKKVLLLALLLAASLLLALTSGAADIPHLWSVLAHPFGSSQESAIIWQVRIPRILMALVSGCALGLAGVFAQGALANPLAEPSLIGASGGAALATVLAIILGVASVGSLSAFIFASLGALAATFLVAWLATRDRTIPPLRLIIVGFALSALLSACVGFITTMVTRADARSVSFWSLGSLALSTYSNVAIVLAIFIIAASLSALFISDLDVLSLGDVRAKVLGVQPLIVRRRSLVLMSLLVGATVSTIGSIAFLALAAPHIARLLVGPRHKELLLSAPLVGAIILVLADTASRSIAPPHEFNVGLFTAILGAPILIWLVKR